MAPNVPAEIDLFTVPHSRMKELVNTYTQKVQCVDFRDCQETFNLLKELQTTLYEFKSHECIENLFIMDQLKNRLKQRHIYNSAVCDCHNDNRLSEMLNLVRNGKHLGKSSIGERLNYGEELQKSFHDFVQQFLPHMEEEEEVFQPLLVEHFEYDELRVLKEVVLEQHELIKDPLYQEKAELDLPETDTAIKDFRDIDPDIWSLADLYNETPDEASQDKKSFCSFSVETEEFTPIKNEVFDSDNENFFYAVSNNEFNAIESSNKSQQKGFNLPSEILVKIFSLLTPPDRGRCAQVCSLWNGLVYSSALWKEIYPIQWARGIWTWCDVNLNYVMEDEAVKNDCSHDTKQSWKYDEDADVDESEDVDDTSSQREYFVFASIISYLLPRIGKKVEKLILDAGRGITSRQIRQALILCPNVAYLSAAYTSFDYYTLKGLWAHGCLRKLRHLDLQGCVNIDDNCLLLLTECLISSKKSKRKCPIQICIKNSASREFCLSNETVCTCCIPPSSTASSVRSCSSFNNVCLLYSNRSNSRGCPFLEPQSNESPDSSETEGDLEIEELYIARRNGTKFRLEYLNFSGCYEVTEQGLIFLLNEGLLQHLSYLNISSGFNISGIALHSIVRQCRKLKPENLFYCNSIINGPYPYLANGCDNLYHPIKVCCQAKMDL